MTARRPNQSNNAFGWDLAIAGLACATMTSGFWRIWPDAIGGDLPTLGPILVKAAMAALGFIAIAIHWERALSRVSRDPSGLLFLLLAFASGLWAINPAATLRDSLMLLLVWSFGLALTLRFELKDIAEIFGFAGLFALAAQLVDSGIVSGAKLPLGTFKAALDGDLAFALVGAAWAAFAVPARRNLWLVFFSLMLVGAWAGGDVASLGAVLGACIGTGLLLSVNAMHKGGSTTIIGLAWLLVASIALATAFVLFGSAHVTAAIEALMRTLGPSWMIGNGFGSGGFSLSGSLGDGLGLVGLLAALLVVMTGVAQVILNARKPSAEPVVWMAMVGAMVCAPSEVALSGACLMMFVSASFLLTIFPSKQPMRKPLVMSSPSRLSMLKNANEDADPLGLNELTTKQPRSKTLTPMPLTQRPVTTGIDVASLGLRPRL